MPDTLSPHMPVPSARSAQASLIRAAAARRARIALAGPDLFRVLDVGGRIAGHIQLELHELGVRYRVRRYSSLRHAFTELGEFWRVEDALSCLPLR